MPLRNGPHGYGLVTKLLHWLTVALIAAQFTVGYAVSDDGGDRGGHRGGGGRGQDECRTDHGGHRSDAEQDRLDRLEDACEARQDVADERADERADEPVGAAFDDLASGDLLDGGLSVPEWHVLLGLAIIAVGAVRVLWRRTTPLPPWAPALSPTERRVESGVERVLLSLLFVVPGTGLLLAVGEDDWLPVHITAHVAFFVALAVHVGLVLRHTLVRNDRHLVRML